MNQKQDNQKFIVSYEGKEYEASYSVSAGCVEVEVNWGDDSRKTTTQIGGGSPLSVARMMALEILRSAKERGELG